MPLQNRVTPTGDIVATEHRGMFTGNRGIIHDPATRTLLNKRWSTPAWLTCVCEFRGRRRKVMSRQSWTELFFLDEATAFAAGHRPCFFCRRDDAMRFRAAWEQGNRVSDLGAKAMDAVLHAERLDRGKKRLHPLPMPVDELPDGTMAQANGDSYLVADGKTLRWSFAGYSRADVTGVAVLLTPPSTVRAFQAGYRPVLHPSAAPALG
ncbi:hypothetical protein MTX26_13645 [Bradyrhizobium sp. ISRA443]|uniref:hypothetical protein n=1 Tax=unclassified Bradyrhizobium TaxID=2631580 RepID=UPI00247A34CE|nr:MULTISPECIES: hypothetical protein [unclassified Bradyrhizobium]WGR91516.1 hypothetical protein MTX20_24150 [Bradyrhizobium sp. ISRA435]WGS01795.1 hypothetical protein MTX23_13655 [Bradyrhizobium sp. ISRA436]WGS08681.1 hypothetical protein MTX18_13645 [Bradyrhizobium sp. ISRA437]WGS15569.1 hypothetical protein MTX26_13645 [Bradyrhizobium sp. ISRA443]